MGARGRKSDGLISKLKRTMYSHDCTTFTQHVQPKDIAPDPSSNEHTILDIYAYTSVVPRGRSRDPWSREASGWEERSPVAGGS